MHGKIERHVKNRLKSIETGKGLDWATAEVCGFPLFFFHCVQLGCHMLMYYAVGLSVWVAHDRRVRCAHFGAGCGEGDVQSPTCDAGGPENREFDRAPE